MPAFGVSVLTVLVSAASATLAFAHAPLDGGNRGSGGTTGSRSIFLNGVDISSAKSQDLKHVDIHIGENGDMFIIAPHYQVNEEDTYIPLSKYVQGLNQPAHKAPQAIEAGRTRELPADAPAGGQLMPKAGEVPPPVAATQMMQAKAGTPTNPAPVAPAASALPVRGDEAPKAEATPASRGDDQSVPLDPAVAPTAAPAAAALAPAAGPSAEPEK